MKYAKDYAEECYEHIKDFDMRAKNLIVDAIELAILRRLEDYKNTVYFPLLQENKELKNLLINREKSNEYKYIAGENLKEGDIVMLLENKIYKKE